MRFEKIKYLITTGLFISLLCVDILNIGVVVYQVCIVIIYYRKKFMLFFYQLVSDFSDLTNLSIIQYHSTAICTDANTI